MSARPQGRGPVGVVRGGGTGPGRAGLSESPALCFANDGTISEPVSGLPKAAEPPGVASWDVALTLWRQRGPWAGA